MNKEDGLIAEFRYHITWGNNSALSVDQGGSIELGGSGFAKGVGTPYIDFHYKDKVEYFNTRIINDADGQLTLVAQVVVKANLDINGGAFLGYENTINNFNQPLKSGFYQWGGPQIPGDVPDESHSWTHLITSRHSNITNNHQLQIGSSYTDNDRLFFRKIQGGTAEPCDSLWHEIATRSSNTFNGDQTFQGNLIVQGAQQNIIKVVTITKAVVNAGVDSPANWSVTYSDFSQVYAVFAVLQGFSIFGNDNNTKFDHWDHFLGVEGIIQHVFLRVDKFDTTTAQGVAYCSEAGKGEGDNSILFTVVVMGRGNQP